MWRYAFALPVPAIITGSDAQDEHAIANVPTYAVPRRTYWSVDETGIIIDFDFGAPVTLAGYHIENTNCEAWSAFTSADQSAFTPVQTAFTLPVDDQLGGRNRGFLPTPGATLQYGRLALLTARTPSPGFFEVGSIVPILASSIYTAGASFGAPLVPEIIDPTTDLPLLGGGTEVNEDGPRKRAWRLFGGLQDGRWKREARADLFRLSALRKGALIWVDLNDGDASHAYLGWLRQPVVPADFGLAVPIGGELVFEEYPYAVTSGTGALTGGGWSEGPWGEGAWNEPPTP